MTVYIPIVISGELNREKILWNRKYGITMFNIKNILNYHAITITCISLSQLRMVQLINRTECWTSETAEQLLHPPLRKSEMELQMHAFLILPLDGDH
jgi:hypothetical protein